MNKLAMVAGVLLGAGAASAAPVVLIDGDGFFQEDWNVNANVTEGVEAGGLGAALVTLTARNQALNNTNPAPYLPAEGNTILSAEIFVTQTEVFDEEQTASTSQGINRMRIVFRNPDDGAQAATMFGGPGGFGSTGMQWFPQEVNTWTTFTYDLTQHPSWNPDWATTWEILRFEFNENDDAPHQNSFYIRNLQLVPEPGTLGLIGIAMGSMLLRRRR